MAIQNQKIKSFVERDTRECEKPTDGCVSVTYTENTSDSTRRILGKIACVAFQTSFRIRYFLKILKSYYIRNDEKRCNFQDSL